MRRRNIARKVIYPVVLASALVLKPPLFDVYAQEKQKSAQVKLPPKQKKKLFKDFDKAVKKGDADKVKELLGKGGDLFSEKRKTSALILATKKGHLDVVKLLVGAGADFNIQDMNSYKTRETGWTPLIYAAYKCRINVVKYYVEELGVPVDQPGAGGETPLMVASFFRQDDFDASLGVIDYLLSKGADVNARSDNGVTPVMSASISGRLKVIKKLVEAGADVNMETTAHGDTALLFSVEKNHWKVARFLIKQGAKVDAQNNYGISPLIKASGSGAVDTIKVLLANKADVNLKDAEGRTALMHAVRVVPPKWHSEPSEGDSEKVIASKKKKALCRERCIETIEILLLAKNIDINAKDKDGKTALDHSDEEDLKELLRKHGAK